MLSYDELLNQLADSCEGFSGAALASVARAAASHALERSVHEFAEAPDGSDEATIMDCVVTKDDFFGAVEDVLDSMGNADFSEEEVEKEEAMAADDGDDGGESEEENEPVRDPSSGDRWGYSNSNDVLK